MRAVAADELFDRQTRGLPPLDVHGVAEGADHEDAGALFGVGVLGGDNRHPRAVERRDGVLAEELLVALVVGVGDHRDAGAAAAPGGWWRSAARRRPRPRSADRRTGPDAGRSSTSAWATAVLKSMSHMVGRLDVVDLAFLHQVEEAELRDAAAVVVDRGVLLGPVEGQPEVAPQMLEGLFVLGGDEAAGLDEVAPRDLLDLLALAARRGPASSPGRRAGGGCSGCRAGSAPGARWAGRCRPSPSERRCSCRSSAGSAPAGPRGCS